MLLMFNTHASIALACGSLFGCEFHIYIVGRMFGWWYLTVAFWRCSETNSMWEGGIANCCLAESLEFWR